MAELFGRVVRVEAGVPGQSGISIPGDLRIAFDIQKTDGPEPNSGACQIYNLSTDSAGELEKLQGTGVVQIFGGYVGQTPGLLFLGDITDVVTGVESVDRITKIESGDGQVALTTARSSKTYKGPTSVSDVIGDLAQDLGLSRSKAKAAANNALPEALREMPRGIATAGATFDSIKKITRANRLDWWIEDGELQVVKKNTAVQDTAILLSPSTGLIGSPQLGSTGQDKKQKQVLRAKTLLRPDIRPRHVVKIESNEFNNFYLVKSVRHFGDSGWSSDYYTEIEAVAT